MTRVAVLLSRVFAFFLHYSPLRNWSTTKDSSAISTWVKSLAAIFDIDRLVSLDVAWWPFEVTTFIEKRFRGKQITVFEWGSGASTIWMLKRGYKVTSVEHDEWWAQKVLDKARELGLKFDSVIQLPNQSKDPRIGSNKNGFANLDFYDYVNQIAGYGLFDLIVIDGRARVECLLAAKSHLKKDGIILFDNIL
jgi:hypothetical protein